MMSIPHEKSRFQTGVKKKIFYGKNHGKNSLSKISIGLEDGRENTAE